MSGTGRCFFHSRGAATRDLGSTRRRLPELLGHISLQNWYKSNDSRIAPNGAVFIPGEQLPEILGRSRGAYPSFGVTFPCKAGSPRCPRGPTGCSREPTKEVQGVRRGPTRGAHGMARGSKTRKHSPLSDSDRGGFPPRI